MIERLFQNKPKSIHDIIPSQFFTTYDSYDYVWSGNCFEWYYAISKTIKPKTFLEIGVRFGFSFLPTMLGNPDMEYALGWDLETYGHTNIKSKNHIKNYYFGDVKWDLLTQDSQIAKELPGFYDLISIDGCHDYACKLHDLDLCIGKCNYIILDDYDYHTDVRNSVNDWMRSNITEIEWGLYIPTFRGSMLIKLKNENN
jgi:hypothetical protein